MLAPSLGDERSSFICFLYYLWFLFICLFYAPAFCLNLSHNFPSVNFALFEMKSLCKKYEKYKATQGVNRNTMHHRSLTRMRTRMKSMRRNRRIMTATGVPKISLRAKILIAFLLISGATARAIVSTDPTNQIVLLTNHQVIKTCAQAFYASLSPPAKGGWRSSNPRESIQL